MLSLFVRQRLTMVVAKQRASDLERLTELIESGAVTPSVDRTYPLDHAAEAIASPGHRRHPRQGRHHHLMLPMTTGPRRRRPSSPPSTARLSKEGPPCPRLASSRTTRLRRRPPHRPTQAHSSFGLSDDHGRISGARGRRARPEPVPVAVAGEVDPRDPALRRAGFLWVGFAASSVVAFFAILFTGRYPRAIFAFNVGVLRWTWRVNYYAYGALGTDRYPPFTLADVPDYPAQLEVAYPAHLSRGLVLVKWWLLAIPHYVVVGLFVGGGWCARPDRDGGDRAGAGGGLIGVLVLVAGRRARVHRAYPRPLYDLVLGMDRWALRVAAYAGLMTDEYPPFRLDMGGNDPASVVLDSPPPASQPLLLVAGGHVDIVSRNAAERGRHTTKAPVRSRGPGPSRAGGRYWV